MTESIEKKLVLPKKNYGPACMRILREFIKHHKLNKNLPVPSMHMTIEESLSRIFDIMLHTMGNAKRTEIIKAIDEYVESLPPTLR